MTRRARKAWNGGTRRMPQNGAHPMIDREDGR